MTPRQAAQATNSRPVDLRAESVELRDIENWLREWVASVDPEAKVSIAPPHETSSKRGVALHLIELVRNPQLRGPNAPALEVRLGYSVTTWGEVPQEADRLLVDLALSVVGRSDVELDLTPRDPAYWLALKAAPRPSITIRLPVRRERPRVDAKRVRFPLVLEAARRTIVAGVVRGPEDTPLPGASVELVGLDQMTRTDRSGRFAFTGVPQTEAGVRLRVRAKGVRLDVPVSGDKVGTTEVSIQLDL